MLPLGGTACPASNLGTGQVAQPLKFAYAARLIRQASLVALVQLIAAAESQEAAEALRRRAASRLSAAERNSPAEGAEAPLLPLLAWSEWLGVPGPAPLAARLEGSP